MIEHVDVPGRSLIAGAFPRVDYADAYRARLPAGAPTDIDALVRAAFGAAPGWIGKLMTLRDRVVHVAGLKTSRRGKRDLAHATFQPGESFGIFRVFARSTDEILLGEDDRHLDFRVSVLRQSADATDWVIISTIVRFNNWLGRAYFWPVRLIHQLIVPALLRSALHSLGDT